MGFHSAKVPIHNPDSREFYYELAPVLHAPLMGLLNAWMRCWLCGGAWGECARRSGRPEAHQADFCCEWSGGPEAGNASEAHFSRIPRGVVAPMRDAGDRG